MLTESYKKRLLELSGILSEITSKEAFDKFYSDTTKFPALKGDEELFNKINDTIPSDNNQFNRGYFEWLYRLYAKGNLPINKLEKVKDYLQLFKTYINVIPQEYRDINKLKSLDDLYNVVREFEGKEDIIPVSKTQQIKKIKEEVDKVYDDGDWIVLVPTTERAACIVGKGTKWCTSADENNMFESYYDEGNLYIIIDKSNNKKYQLHIERKEFKDETNNDIEVLHFFDYVAEGSNLFDFFKDESELFHEFILFEGIDELANGGYSETFNELINDIYYRDSKIEITELRKDAALDLMREYAPYNDDLIYYGFVFEKNPENITQNQIVDLLQNKNIEEETLERIFEHLKEIGFDFEETNIDVNEYVKAKENLEKLNKKINVNYTLDNGYVLRINSLDVLNKEKPYKVTLRHSEKGDKSGSINIETLNNLFTQGILFEKK
jgi:hypothetical protein